MARVCCAEARRGRSVVREVAMIRRRVVSGVRMLVAESRRALEVSLSLASAAVVAVAAKRASG